MKIQLTDARLEKDKRGTVLVQEFQYLDGPFVGQRGRIVTRPVTVERQSPVTQAWEGGDVE